MKLISEDRQERPLEIQRPLRKPITDSGAPAVSIERLERNIIELGKIGRNAEDGGVYRPGFSEADMEGRRWLMDKIEAAGLKASMDGAANVFGLDDRAGTKSSFLVGSHLDTVPCGGVLDGALGVLTALECLQVIRERDVALNDNLELVATSEEEGRFGGMIGAEAICGEISPDRIRKARDVNGVSLEDAMTAAGLEPSDMLRARRHREYMSGFLELHIEQGPVLDAHDLDIGIVESISGIFHWRVTLIGEANHSGTTPMNMRRDAFLGLSEFANEIPRILEENGTADSRATIGKIELHPPSPHTVPGRVEFSLIGRDFTPDSMDELETAFRKALSAISRRRHLRFEYDEISRIAPTTLDPDLADMLESQANRLGLKQMRMPSGAGHDVQFFAKYMPAGMIFIPSLRGISHSPDEWSSLEHIEMGANLMLHTLIARLAV